MYWVSSKHYDANNRYDVYGVTDTTDNVETYFLAEELFDIIFEDNIKIDGVDVNSRKISVIKLPSDTVRLLKKGNIHLAVHTMSLTGYWFGLKLKSKPTGGEMTIVKNQILNINRFGVNTYGMIRGTSSKYYDNLSADDVISIILDYLSRGWSIVDVLKGGL